MHVLVRCLLIWLMALAVPLQGVAAASLRHCLPDHERPKAGQVRPSPVGIQQSGKATFAGERTGTPHAAGHSHAGPSHSRHAADTDAGPGSTAHEAGPHKTADSFKAGKCSACAACCVALGLPAPAVQVPVVPADAFIAILRTTAPPSFVPGGLDRPPRRPLAAT